MSERNGGPAFPQPPCPDCGTRHEPEHVPGMTLRDYFAAKALHAVVSNDTWASYLTQEGEGVKGRDKAAGIAFQLADAMLRAR